VVSRLWGYSANPSSAHPVLAGDLLRLDFSFVSGHSKSNEIDGAKAETGARRQTALTHFRTHPLLFTLPNYPSRRL
jgi:hypothetical protein